MAELKRLKYFADGEWEKFPDRQVHGGDQFQHWEKSSPRPRAARRQK